MRFTEDDIKHESGDFFVLKVPKGFEVLKNGITHSTRCSIFGKGLPDALERAIADCDKRASEAN